MDIGLTFVVNVTVTVLVSTLGNAVMFLNVNMCHEDIQGNNWD